MSLPGLRRSMASMDWQRDVGYQRVVRAGPHVVVSGTVGVKEDGSIAVGDAYAQARRALERIRGDLKQAGANMSDVVRTRIYVTAMKDWPEVARAHREVFGEHPPASTLVEVSGLILKEALVEIEADAILGQRVPTTG